MNSTLRFPTLFVGLIAILFSSSTFAGKVDVPESLDGTTRVSAEELIELAGKLPNIVMIDARKSSDHEKGYIEGSIGLPDTETDAESLAKIIPSKQTPVLFYCNGVKCGRSVKSANKALALGYKEIYWFRGGWEEWTAKGLPVTK
jgi:rhodanese-related sulfurtransferase